MIFLQVLLDDVKLSEQVMDLVFFILIVLSHQKQVQTSANKIMITITDWLLGLFGLVRTLQKFHLSATVSRRTSFFLFIKISSIASHYSVSRIFKLSVCFRAKKLIFLSKPEQTDAYIRFLMKFPITSFVFP